MDRETPETELLERAFMEASGLTIPAPQSDPELWREDPPDER